MLFYLRKSFFWKWWS